MKQISATSVLGVNPGFTNTYVNVNSIPFNIEHIFIFPIKSTMGTSLE